MIRPDAVEGLPRSQTSEDKVHRRIGLPSFEEVVEQVEDLPGIAPGASGRPRLGPAASSLDMCGSCSEKLVHKVRMERRREPSPHWGERPP